MADQIAQKKLLVNLKMFQKIVSKMNHTGGLKNKKDEQSNSELWDNFKKLTIHVMRATNGEEREMGTKKNLKKTWPKIFKTVWKL